MEYNNLFPTRLKILRESHNVSMSEMAEFLFMQGSAAINQFERGRSKPSVDTAVQISLFFGVSLEWVVGLSDIPYTPNSVQIANKARVERIQRLKDVLENDFQGTITFINHKSLINKAKRPDLLPSLSLNFLGNIVFLNNATYLNDAEHHLQGAPLTLLTNPTYSPPYYIKMKGRLMQNKADRYRALFDCYNANYSEPLFIIS